MNAALLLTALFNGAWQGALLCAGAVLVFRLFRRLNATTMFTVWTVLLGLCVALPAANYAFASKPYTVRIKLAPVAIVAPVREPVRRAASHVTSPVVYRLAESTPSLHDRIASAADALYSHANALLWTLFLIAFVRLAVLARDVVRMLQARKRVRPIEPPVTLSDDVERPFRFAASNEFTSPCVLGFAPALIVIPEDLLGEQEHKLHSIVLHEREHVRRFDDVQNVAHRFIGAIAFFCPGVRIALRELALYREQICDDAAIDGTGDRVSYAMTLTGMSQWAQGRGAPVPSFVFKRKQLLHRLEVLLDSAVSHSLRMNRRFAVSAGCTLAVAALLVLRVQVPVIAQSIIAPAVPPAVPAPHVRPVAKVLQANPRQAKVSQPKAAPLPKRPAESPKPALAASKPLPPLNAGNPKIAYVPVAARNAAEYAARQAVTAPPPPAAGVAAHIDVRSPVPPPHSEDLLDTLNSVGLRDLSVDDLIALRDHGVTPELIRAATSYFGRIGARELAYLADHGVGPKYIETLRASGVTGIPPASAVLLMDHGVSASLINTASAYFNPRPSPADLAYLSDHGVSAATIESYRNAGIAGVTPADVALLFDHGVTGAYVAKVRRMYPRAGIDDIIRLHDNGI